MGIRQQIKVCCAAMSAEVFKVLRAVSCAVPTNVNLMLYLLSGPVVVQRQQMYILKSSELRPAEISVSNSHV